MTVPRSDEEAERCHSRAGERTSPRARSHALRCATMRALLYPVSSAFLITLFALIPGSSSLRGNQMGSRCSRGVHWSLADANSRLLQRMGLTDSAPPHLSPIITDNEHTVSACGGASRARLGRAPARSSPPQGTVTARWGLPVSLADPVIGFDGIFLIHVLLAVRPTGSGIDVWLLGDPRLRINKLWL